MEINNYKIRFGYEKRKLIANLLNFFRATFIIYKKYLFVSSLNPVYTQMLVTALNK